MGESTRIRRIRFLQLQLCPRDSKPLVPGKTVCRTCLKALRERYKRVVATGFCPRHRAEKIAPGRKRCQRCINATRRLYRERQHAGKCPQHPDQALNGRASCVKCSWRAIWRNYGLTLVAWRKLWRLQKGRCACCATRLTQQPGRNCHVDHCHRTRKIRGLLCQKCNTTIAHLERAATKGAPDYAGYIVKHKKTVLKLPGNPYFRR